MWENMGDRMYDMFIGHEVSHALFTPAGETNLLDALRAVSGVSVEGKAWHAAKMLLNVVEDARIERLIQRKFPGLVRDFREGYAEIIERDFFGLGDEHPNERGFVDRLNIHFKAGAHFTIDFDSEELQFVERIEDAETWDEAVEISRDLYEFRWTHQRRRVPRVEVSRVPKPVTVSRASRARFRRSKTKTETQWVLVVLGRRRIRR